MKPHAQQPKKNKKNTIYGENKNTNIMQNFSFIPFMTSEKIFGYFFQKFSLSVCMATNQNQWFWQNSYGW